MIRYKEIEEYDYMGGYINKIREQQMNQRFPKQVLPTSGSSTRTNNRIFFYQIDKAGGGNGEKWRWTILRTGERQLRVKMSDSVIMC